MGSWSKCKAAVRKGIKRVYLQANRAGDALRCFDISIFHKMRPPPDGGGNQFLRALWIEFERRGYKVENNRISAKTRACVFNSFNFDAERLRILNREGCRMVHRVDGPIDVYRGYEAGVDKGIQRLNAEFADATVFQSNYSLKAHMDRNLVFQSPTVISNAVDPAIFYDDGRRKLAESGKVRLLAMSWSDNENKGASIFKWLEGQLDWGKYDFTFVGRSPITFSRIKTLEPMDSQAVADQLRRSDIFVFASKYESCSNALAEALACGVPCLYIDSGSNAEVVGKGGMAFETKEEIPVMLEALVNKYDSIRAEIRPRNLSHVCDEYLEVLNLDPTKN